MSSLNGDAVRGSSLIRFIGKERNATADDDVVDGSSILIPQV